jgi:hypothetical protein
VQDFQRRGVQGLSSGKATARLPFSQQSPPDVAPELRRFFLQVTYHSHKKAKKTSCDLTTVMRNR